MAVAERKWDVVSMALEETRSNTATERRLWRQEERSQLLPGVSMVRVQSRVELACPRRIHVLGYEPLCPPRRWHTLQTTHAEPEVDGGQTLDHPAGN